MVTLLLNLHLFLIWILKLFSKQQMSNRKRYVLLNSNAKCNIHIFKLLIKNLYVVFFVKFVYSIID